MAIGMINHRSFIARATRGLLLGLTLALLCPCPQYAGAQTSQNGPITVYPAIQFNPTSLTFPSTAVGISSAPQTVLVINADTGSNHTITVSLTGTDAGDYSQTNDCPSTLSGGGPQTPSSTCHVTVTFTPTATGTRTANAQINLASPSGFHYTAALSGTGH